VVLSRRGPRCSSVIDNTNIQTPDFGPALPTYPHLEQLCRVSASALVGTSPAVYPAFVEQFAPPLSLRDREPAYVVEPNRVVLGPGIYDTRLIGAFPTAGHALYGIIPQLPLYCTTCCLVGGFSSSSGSSTSQAPALGVPTGLSATPGHFLINLAWNPLPGATTYNLYRAFISHGEGSAPYATGLTGTSFSDTGLHDVKYYYQLSGVNSAGEGPLSAEVSATPF
jgi:hypothetical protein